MDQAIDHLVDDRVDQTVGQIGGQGHGVAGASVLRFDLDAGDPHVIHFNDRLAATVAGENIADAPHRETGDQKKKQDLGENAGDL